MTTGEGTRREDEKTEAEEAARRYGAGPGALPSKTELAELVALATSKIPVHTSDVDTRQPEGAAEADEAPIWRHCGWHEPHPGSPAGKPEPLRASRRLASACTTCGEVLVAYCSDDFTGEPHACPWLLERTLFTDDGPARTSEVAPDGETCASKTHEGECGRPHTTAPAGLPADHGWVARYTEALGPATPTPAAIRRVMTVAAAEHAAAAGEVERLRGRVHSAVDECQRRYASMQSSYDRLMGYRREVIARHGRDQVAKGEHPGANISERNIAVATVIVEEREQARDALTALNATLELREAAKLREAARRALTWAGDMSDDDAAGLWIAITGGSIAEGSNWTDAQAVARATRRRPEPGTTREQ